MNEIDLLLESLHRAFDRRSWHGPNLMGSIRGLTVEMAAFRPAPNRHNAWEYVVHAAYWKYRVVRLLDEERSDGFSFTGSNFFPRPGDASASALKHDIDVLRSWQTQLIETVSSLRPPDLNLQPGRREFDNRSLILGAAAHDVYHAGQIRLLRRLFEERA